ncbi:MAG: tyrosine-type recombinase/integrase [Promethearchaeota archaeon]
MTQANKGSYVNDKKNELILLNPVFDDYFTFKLEQLSYHSQQTNLNALSRFYDLTGKFVPKNLTKDDIKDLINNEKFKKLSNRTKNTYLSELKKYFDYFERKDLIEIFPTYSMKSKELNKTDLISRKELDLILKNVGMKKRAMIMVNYEGALRRDELVNILFRDVKFPEKDEEFLDIYIGKSKTVSRNITLIESVPYLREYFNQNDFKPEDKIFDYHPQWITTYYSRLTEKLKKRYPDWNKDLHPHLFRHSRLTELALTKLNEPQLRKFAGWTKESQMASIYFHIDDTDIRNILLEQNGQKPKKTKAKTFKKIICEVCKTENNQQNAFCYKCGHVVNKERIVIDRLEEKEDIQRLKEENKELKDELEAMKDLYKEEMNNMREEMKSLFDDLYYRDDLEKRIKKGEITEAEARLEYHGIKKDEI